MEKEGSLIFSALFFGIPALSRFVQSTQPAFLFFFSCGSPTTLCVRYSGWSKNINRIIEFQICFMSFLFVTGMLNCKFSIIDILVSRRRKQWVLDVTMKFCSNVKKEISQSLTVSLTMHLNSVQMIGK